MTTPRILIADDQSDVLTALRLLLKSEGYGCVTVGSPAEALDRAAKESFDAALVDLNYTRDTTSGAEGLELLQGLKKGDASMPVVVMTAWGSIDLAVRAMQCGASDFVEKPWDNQRLLNVLGAQVNWSREHRRAERLDAENALLKGTGEEPFIAESPAMRPVLEMIARIAPTDANVLVLGENGTGKGVVARRIHASSRRRERSLIKINMGGINENVFESEMFGHVKGAFTDAKNDRLGRFELADGGTLFLDEIANIPPAQQPKLLRVLEEGEFERVGSSRTLKVDVRLVSATNANLKDEVEAGRFRKDLLFRLNTVEITLPPLRQRREDIQPMASDFLHRCARRYQRDGLSFSPSALSRLREYAWPGNVRELGHVVERAVLMAAGGQIQADELGLGNPAGVPSGASVVDTDMTLEQLEESMVRHALEVCEGNIQRAADKLGLSRGALYRRLEKYGLGSGEE